MRKLLTLFLTLSFYTSIAQHAIIPAPVSYEPQDGAFTLNSNTKLFIKSEDPAVTGYVSAFNDWMSKSGLELEQVNKEVENSISIALNTSPNASLGQEGYELIVETKKIKLVANTASGVFYGLETLKQLLPPAFEQPVAQISGASIAGCKIMDYPNFQWRGLMLDVSRHFFSVEDVKLYINQMSKYKFNVLHWHLTDDEGWRIEIKSLPKLTQVGAWRVERYGRFGSTRPYPKEGEKATYGGFYTQEQIKEVIAYAAERNITIVPEIDMPGHSMAALAAYPELSVNKEPKFVNPGAKFSEWHGGGKFKMLIENTLNPTDERVYEFVDKVFTEVAELIPGEYIHMGGDECYQGYWAEDPEVQKFMKKNKLKDTHALQSYFVSRVNEIISSKGKKMIGWDEILEGGLADGAAVMSWRGMKGGIEAAKLGHKVVMSPTTYAYLDYTQGDHSVENRIYADLSLEKTYEFNPVPDGVDENLILGGQGNLWTEAIPNMQFALYMTYPRAFAIAESVWSMTDQKDLSDFISRTERHFDRFTSAELNISQAVYDPIIRVYKEGDKMMCELNNSVPGTTIYYTIDNTYPTAFGKVYTAPFEIPQGNLSLRAGTYRDGKLLGRELLIPRDELAKRVTN